MTGHGAAPAGRRPGRRPGRRSGRPPVVAALALVLAVGLTGLAGCSDDDGSDGAAGTDGGATSTTVAATPTASTAPPVPYDPAAATEEAYVAAMATGLSSGAADQGQLVVSAEQAACLAPVWVTAIGVDALRTAQVAPDILADPAYTFDELALDATQAATMVDAYAPCGADLFGLFALALTPDQEPAIQTCAVASIDHDLARTALMAGLQRSTSLTDALNAVIQQVVDACQPS